MRTTREACITITTPFHARLGPTMMMMGGGDDDDDDDDDDVPAARLGYCMGVFHW